MPKEPQLEYPAPEDARSPHETYRILFLDSAENIEKLKEACKEAGYVVVGATTLEDAWAFLEGKDHVDVIVCAAHLEEESMFEFLKGVRESEQHRNSGFLILSLEPGVVGGRLDRSTARAGIVLGADAYLMMPVFDPDELVSQIGKRRPPVPVLQQSSTADEKSRT